MAVIINLEEFKSIYPNAKDAEKIVDAINIYAPKFGINTPARMAMFLAQAGHESGDFRTFEENLNYSADGLANTWPTRYALKKNGVYATAIGTKRKLPNALANSISRNKEKIANHTYADRMGNGSPDTGDGWKYRGRGIFQLTGKDNYTRLAKDEPALVSCLDNPDMLLQPYEAVISACWFWNANNLNKSADAKDIKTNTKLINGGYIGLDHRTSLYEKNYKFMV